jgi:hypothetical protein
MRMLRIIAAIALAFAWLSLLTGYAHVFATCRPGDPGIYVGGMLAAGCR